MKKLNPIKYIEDALSHHPKTILLWMTEGIVIDGNRYIIKEFRLKDDKLYAVIANNEYNPEYFEVQLCTDEGTLKDIYKAIEENKIAIEKEVTDRKNEINRVDSKVTELQGNIKPIVSDNTELLTVTKEESQIKLTPFHDVQKEQVLESTRNTVNIHHGSNGTTEKTTVDTNPQKVLEHENLISDSEYITLNHQTGENTTHIQTARLKAELDELYEIISSIGGGGGLETHTIQAFQGNGFHAWEHFDQVGDSLRTFSFVCYGDAECVITGELKQKLENYLIVYSTHSNGALTITYDGTNMKLINSAPSENVCQHATFTFHGFTSS